MSKITIINGNELKELDGTFNKQVDGTALEEKTIHGQVFNHPRGYLATLLGPLKNGQLTTVLDGKRYKLTELQLDGRFKAEADFEP